MCKVYFNNVDWFELKTHLLIAGATGSGKSTAMKTIIDYMIKYNTGKFVMIDLKRIELNEYQGLKSLLLPIAKDEKQALKTLKKVSNEMERRYYLLENGYVNNFKDMFLCIDEIAELTSTLDRQNKKEFIFYLSKLARLGRAAGIHLIVATQYPTRAVLPMQLLMNIDNRFCLRTANKQGSRVVLENGIASELNRPGIGYLKTSTDFDLKLINVEYHSSETRKRLVTNYNKSGH